MTALDEALLASGLTTSQLARKAQISRAIVSVALSGMRPSARVRWAIAGALDLKPQDLFPEPDRSDVKTARRARGWTQSQLAEACGVSQAELSRIERGRIPTNDIADRIDAVLFA